MRHDYRCPTCRTLLRDQYRTAAEGGQHTAPDCPSCGIPMDWVPAARFDLRSDGEGQSGATFQKFTTLDGRNQPVTIDSLHKLRQVERESEIAARNGEGQRMVFRSHAQNRGNMDAGTLGEPPSQKPSAAARAKYGLRAGSGPTSAPEPGFGPGVTEANTSALPMSGTD